MFGTECTMRVVIIVLVVVLGFIAVGLPKPASLVVVVPTATNTSTMVISHSERFAQHANHALSAAIGRRNHHSRPVQLLCTRNHTDVIPCAQLHEVGKVLLQFCWILSPSPARRP